MRRSTRDNLSRSLITAVVGGLVAWLYGRSRWDGIVTQKDAFRVLCDAFSIPGLFMVLFAGLLSLNYAGALDTIAYLLSYIPRMLAPGAFGEPEKFYDFVENRRENRKKGYGFLYVVGMLFLGIALYYLYRFYTV